MQDGHVIAGCYGESLERLHGAGRLNAGGVAIDPDLALVSACCGAGKLQDDKLKRIVSAEVQAIAIWCAWFMATPVL